MNTAFLMVWDERRATMWFANKESVVEWLNNNKPVDWPDFVVDVDMWDVMNPRSLF